ncbi:hypothetical protein M0R45_032544 [Rubus argutus]|uniref:Uncharacterized protein n=1 Tax=Rubus argutus TaxID=59490 RepID=A0AAW1WK45_RUBAR
MEMIATGRNVGEGNPDPVSIVGESDRSRNRCGTAVYSGGGQERVGSTVWGRAKHGLGLKSTAVMEFSEIDQRWMGVLSRT